MEKIPSKHQERKDDHRRKKSPTVSLPPLTPTNNRQNPKNPPWTTSRGPPYVSRNSQRPYRVLHIGATPLMHACQQADRSRVLRLLKEQEETIGYRDRTLRSALHYCMDAGTGGAVASAAPELVNAPDAEGHTPLHLAVIAGDTQLVAVLLANGADVTAKDLEGHGVVHWATVCGEAECVRLVLAAGARPSTPDLRGGSPLHYAAQCCGAAAQLSVPKKVGLNVLETLVEFGADVNAKDEDGRQPILWAASAGSVEAVLALARAGGSAAAGATDKDGLTALHCAASRGQTRCVEALVNLCGCHPDHVDDNGCSALHYAATLGHADATALLLRLGADPNRQDRKGRTPALCAAAKGQLETLKILAEHGGSLHARTVRGTGVAHEAVLSGRTELVEWLAKKRPSTLDVATHDGKTPLHVAALHGYLDVCKLLLDHGARINAVLRTSKSGPMTALDAALYRGHRDCAKLVQMHGGTSAQRLKTLRDNQVFTSGKLERGETSDDLERWIDERRRSRKSICREELSRRRAAAAAAAAAASADGGGGGGGRRRARSEQRSGVCWKKFDKIESWSETNEYSDEKKERVKKFSRKAVRGDKLISDDSLSDDSLEVVVVKKSLEKTSGRIKTRSKVPRETWRETRFTETRRRTRRSDNKKFSEEVADNKSEENKRERKFEKDATDYSTSEETAERVTVTALVHKDTRKDSSVRGGSSKDDLIGENMPRASEINESTEETRRETTGNDGTTSQIESQRDDDATSDKESKGERRNEKTSEGLVLTQQEGERSEKSEKSEKTDGSTAGNLLQSESLDSREEYKESGGPSDESSDKIDESIGKVGESVGKVGESVGKVGESVGKVGESVGKVGESVGKIDESVGKIGESVGKIDESVGKIDESIDKIDESIDKIDEKEEALEYKQPNDETIESDRSSRPTIEVSNKFDESSGSGEKSRGEKRGDESSREGSRSENRRRAESSEEGSPDRSAIVAVIEEWDEIPGGVSTSHSSLGAIGTVELQVNERRGGSREEGAKQRRDSGGRDSGIEPSPRVSRIPKRTAKYCPSTRIDMVTRDVQISLRRYHLERKIFFQLMELKRLQIRHGRANEHVLVKRQVETFHKAGMSGPALGVARYDQPLTFRHFEAFLYEQLRRLQRRPATPDFCTEAKQCTQKTHRCHHATSAYTSVPIYTYLDGRGQEREDCLLPRIESRGRAQMTVRVTRGEEKRVIALPADRTKRYYVTFTVRGEGNESSGGIEESRSNAQRNTKSV